MKQLKLEKKTRQQLEKLQNKFDKIYKARVSALNRECAHYCAIRKQIQFALYNLDKVAKVRSSNPFEQDYDDEE